MANATIAGITKTIQANGGRMFFPSERYVVDFAPDFDRWYAGSQRRQRTVRPVRIVHDLAPGAERWAERLLREEVVDA